MECEAQGDQIYWRNLRRGGGGQTSLLEEECGQPGGAVLARGMECHSIGDTEEDDTAVPTWQLPVSSMPIAGPMGT